MVEIPAVEKTASASRRFGSLRLMLAWFPIVLAIVSQSVNDLVDRVRGLRKISLRKKS